MRKFRIFAYLMLCLVVLSGMALAQTPTAARIVGVVTDEAGTALPGVSVEAINPKMVGKVSVVSDASGIYRLLGLLPGTYQVTFSLAGFKTVVRKDVVVGMEQSITLDIKMAMGAIEEEVTVIGKSPLIDVKSTTKGMTFTKEVFEYLPKGRDFSSLVSVIPGVQSESKFGGGISVDGASGAENTYYVDGMETSDIRGGRQAQQVAFEFVDEIQVKAAGYQAEYGGSMGGVVQVITRSGGNEFHGEVMGYYSGSNLTSKERDSLRLDPLDPSKAEYINYYDYYDGLGLQPEDNSKRWEAGFNLGGYILRDKLWFFGSVLPVWYRTNREVEFISPVVRGSYDTKTDYLNYQVKLTAAPIQGLRISASYVNNSHTEQGLLPPKDGSGNADYPWDAQGFDYPNFTVGGTLDYTLGSNFLFSARGGYFLIDQKNQKLLPPGPLYNMRNAVDLAGLGWPEEYIVPYNYYSYDWYDQWVTKKAKYTRTSANFDTTYFMEAAGEHSWKFGFQFVRLHDDKESPNLYPLVRLRPGYTYYFFDGVHTGKGKYGYYEVRDPFAFPYKANAFSNRYALYLQDSWTIARKLTLNIGLRAEAEKVPEFSEDPAYEGKVPLDFGFGDKLAPRFGFIYDVFGDSSLKVYGSYSILQDCMKLAMPEGSYGGDQWWSTYYALDTYVWDTIGVDGYFPGEYYETLDWREPSIDSTDPDIKSMAQREISFGVEKQLVENVSASIRFTQRHLMRTIEDIGFASATGESYIIGNPGFGQSSMADPVYPRCPKAKREYTGVNFTLEKRLSNNWLAGFAYTWSHLTGNYAGLDSSDEPGRNDPNVNRYWDYWFNMYDGRLVEIDGPQPTDRPHYFKAYGSYVFPFGLNVGVAAFAYSGTPVTTEVVLNNQQGYYPNNRFDTKERTPFTFYMNLYAEYNLRLGRRYSINFNVNVDNITSTKTAQYTYPIYNMDAPRLSDDQILAGQAAQYAPPGGYVTVLDPRYMMGYNFFAPMSVRLGVKFIF